MSIIARELEQSHPEIKSGHHLPRFAKVVAQREETQQGDICSEYRPRYAVSVQMLDEHGNEDTNFPVLHDVPMSITGGSHESGLLSYPEPGTIVDIAFAYGNVSKPFIRGTLPHNLSFPAVRKDETVLQFGKYVKKTYKNGNQYEESHDVAEVISKKASQIMQWIISTTQFVVNSESSIQILSDIVTRINAGKKLTLSSDKKIEMGAGSDIEIESLSQIEIKSPSNWIGSKEHNLFALVEQLANQNEALCNILQSHTHPNVGGMSEGAAVAAIKTTVASIKTTVAGIKA